MIERFTLKELLCFYRAGRSLGFGEVLGMFNDAQLRDGYESVLQGLQNFSSMSSEEKYSSLAHSFAYLRVLEYEFFGRAHSKITGDLRKLCIDVLVNTCFCRREWFSRGGEAGIPVRLEYSRNSHATSGSQASSH